MRKTALALLASTVLLAGCGGGKSATNRAGAKVFSMSRPLQARFSAGK